MAIRITATIRGMNLTADGTPGLDSSRLTISLGNGTEQVTANSDQLENLDVRLMDNGNTVGGAVINSNSTTTVGHNAVGYIKTGANGSVTRSVNDVKHINIDLPTEVVKKVTRWIKWKDLVKDKNGAHNSGSYTITIKNINYDPAVTEASNPNALPGTFPGLVNNDTLWLQNQDPTHLTFVGGPITADNFRDFFEIDTVDNSTAGAKTLSNATVKFGEGVNEKEVFWKTEKLIDDLKKSIKDGTFDFSTINTKLGELDVYTKPAKGYNKDGGSEVTEDNAKRILYNTTFENEAGARYYKVEIDRLIRLLKEFRIWKEVVGIDNVDDVLRANINEFTVDTRAGNAYANGSIADSDDLTQQKENTAGRAAHNFPNGGGKYKGVPIANKDEQGNVTNTANNFDTDDTHILGRSFATASGTKTQIEGFVILDIFKDQGGDSKKCRGFSPKDVGNTAPCLKITGAAAATYDAGNGDKNILADTDVELQQLNDDGSNKGTPEKKFKYKDLTKICFEILDRHNADHLEEVVRIAYLRNTFDEMEGKSHGEMLEMYDYVAKSTGVRGGILYTGDINGPNRKRFQNCYDMAKGLTDLLDKKPTTDQEHSKWMIDIDEYIENQNGKYGNDGTYFRNHWTSHKQKTKLIEIKKKGKPTQTPPNGGRPTKAEINAARDRVFSQAKSTDANFKKKLKDIFDNNETDLLTKDKAVLEELEKLAKLIDRAYSGDTTLRKSELEAYSKADAEANKKEAWTMANKINDANGKKLGEEALSKAPADKDNDAELAAAKTKAKKDLDNIIKGAGDAIITDALTDKKVVEGILAIFNKCNEAWGKTQDDAKLRGELESYTSKPEWTAINLFKRDNNNNECKVGFATGALNKLKSLMKSRQAIVEKSRLHEADTEAKVDAALVILEKHKDKEPIIKDIVIPRGELMKELFKKGDDKSKALAKLIAENFVKELETDYNDDSYATNLSKLKGKLKELEEYKNGKHKSVYEGLGTTQKNTLDSLIKSVKSKVEAMEKKEKEANNQNNPSKDSEKSWWQKPWGIIGIIVGIILVLGLVAYLIKSNSSEEGEGESE